MGTVCIISTVYNEADTITSLVESLLSQTRQPDEIVITDGGSTDSTFDLLQAMSERAPKLKAMRVPGNRSVGRNAAVTASAADIIACTDAGCEVDREWLERITRPLLESVSVDVASGFYEPKPTTNYEECAGVVCIPAMHEIDPEEFLPSARSVAFRRSAWERVGGYPVEYVWNEDTPFDIALRKAGCKFVFVPDALVRWRPRSTFGNVYIQYRRFAYGDGEALILCPHYLKTLIVYGSAAGLLVSGFWYWPMFGLFVLGVAGYASKLCAKAKRRGIVVTARHVVNLMSAAVARDLGNMAGIVRGLSVRLARSIRGRREGYSE